MRTTLNTSIAIILFLFIGIASVSAQTTLVNPEWEFFDDFEGAVDNTFWAGGGISLNYGVDRPDADSKVMEMIYVPNSEGIPHGDDAPLGDSWTEYDFNLGINAVQVEISFRLLIGA
ncbi:hypothetical protein MNBD_BACTEROID03-2556 [hydrothermal vent metagenome]|uniref:Uncharacterized protein n=1 Tax=hydrothermal vent metagenome TaxID=652676 RepID=A0A3B0SXP9_9ZZZZ